MFKHTDPIVIRHTKIMNDYDKAHPEDNWKTGLSDEQIEELQKKGVNPAEKS